MVGLGLGMFVFSVCLVEVVVQKGWEGQSDASEDGGVLWRWRCIVWGLILLM